MKCNFLSFIYSFIYLEEMGLLEKKRVYLSWRWKREFLPFTATPHRTVRIILSDDQITIFLLVKYCCTFLHRLQTHRQKAAKRRGGFRKVAFWDLISLKLLTLFYFYFYFIPFFHAVCLNGKSYQPSVDDNACFLFIFAAFFLLRD